MSIDTQTQAILLMTVYLGRPGKGDPRPLSPAEWGRFALWLKERDISPGVLVTEDPARHLAGWTDSKVTPERLRYLLDRAAALGLSLEKWQRAGLWVMTRSDPDYPVRLKRHLGTDSPPVLFGCGSRNLLNQGGIAVVGSRDAEADDLTFAARLGQRAARQGLSVVSGGARGVDETVMLGALECVGTAVGVLSDSLLRAATSARYRKPLMANNLVLVSPFNPEAGFDVGNAMARNKYIYCLADAGVVVSSGRGKGGTWNGAIEALRHRWVPLWVKPNPDTRSGNGELARRGAHRLPEGELDLAELFSPDLADRTGEMETLPLLAETGAIEAVAPGADSPYAETLSETGRIREAAADLRTAASPEGGATEEGDPMTDQPENLDLRSADIAEDRRRELLRLFPEARTEGGKIDFERLKLALGDAVDVGKERYGMTWPGKADCFKTIQMPSLGTLRPCREESVDFDTTENLIIEGDNLEVLKLLQKSYLGRVKMIYIDPPYNTGNDFIYPDDYTESLQTYLEYTGQVDSDGKKFSTNSDTDGRFHSKWLNMMYPRLCLAGNLLREDGVVLISIDDNEVDNLRKLLNEIFGEINFVCTLVWEKGRKNDAKLVSVGHEYILVFARSKGHLSENGTVWREAKPGAAEIQAEYQRLRQKFGSDNTAVQKALREFYATLPQSHPSKRLSRYCNVDDIGVWRDDNMSWPGGGGPSYDVIHPVTGKPCALPEGGWRYSTSQKMGEMIAKGKVVFRADHTEPPIRKTYLVRVDDDNGSEAEDEDVGIQVASSCFYRSALQASNTLASLFGAKVFANPKDHEVLTRWIQYVGSKSKDDIILDFFAGSGTTAHAVLDLNRQDGGNRRFILVQLPEPTGREDYPTIADITKERVRRVIQRVSRGDAESAEKKMLQPELFSSVDSASPRELDLGFRVFKLAESNFMPWNAEVPHDARALERQLELHIDHLREGRTADDILYEILLKSGFPLTTPVERLVLAGKTVHSVAGGALFICLERELTLELIRAMAERKPERVVCLDEGFAGNDQLKANAVQIFKTRGVTSFKTV